MTEWFSGKRFLVNSPWHVPGICNVKENLVKRLRISATVANQAPYSRLSSEVPNMSNRDRDQTKATLPTLPYYCFWSYRL